jgi:hypothetical protein
VRAAANCNLRHAAVPKAVVTYPKCVYTASFEKGARVAIGGGGGTW